MMFELLLNVMDRFLNLRDTNAECAIALLPSKANQTVPYGTTILGCLSFSRARYRARGRYRFPGCQHKASVACLRSRPRAATRF